MDRRSPPSKGFLIVASNKISFYYSAINLIESIRDYMPDAKFALFTEKRFMDSRCDNIDYVFECGDFIREKLYALSRTPFDITFYIDADCQVEHEDIVKVFDQLGSDDIKFVKLTDDRIAKQVFTEKDFTNPDGLQTLSLCGGVCLYDIRNPLVKDFMVDWYEIFKKQELEGWVPEGYPKSVCRWDQFTLWWMTNKIDKYKDLKIGIFEENYRWNWFSLFKFDENGNHRLVSKPPIVVHYSGTMQKGRDHSL